MHLLHQNGLDQHLMQKLLQKIRRVSEGNAARAKLKSRRRERTWPTRKGNSIARRQGSALPAGSLSPDTQPAAIAAMSWRREIGAAVTAESYTSGLKLDDRAASVSERGGFWPGDGILLPDQSGRDLNRCAQARACRCPRRLTLLCWRQGLEPGGSPMGHLAYSNDLVDYGGHRNYDGC